MKHWHVSRSTSSSGGVATINTWPSTGRVPVLSEPHVSYYIKKVTTHLLAQQEIYTKRTMCSRVVFTLEYYTNFFSKILLFKNESLNLLGLFDLFIFTKPLSAIPFAPRNYTIYRVSRRIRKCTQWTTSRGYYREVCSLFYRRSYPHFLTNAILT